MPPGRGLPSGRPARPKRAFQHRLFDPALRRYAFLNPDDPFSDIEVPRKTVISMIVDGQETILSAANRTGLNEKTGNLYYARKQGKGKPIPGGVNHENLEENLASIFKMDGFEYLTDASIEVKNN